MEVAGACALMDDEKAASPAPRAAVAFYLRSADITRVAEFDTLIDVRSPAEFAEDHIPGAINCPVLDDAERIEVGTIYKQVSPFEARKLGSKLISQNIARHLAQFNDRPKQWKPLIYCWRGGQRSAAMNIIFSQIGWASHQLEGGYKAYRLDALAALASLPQRFSYRVICGPTGSGKSRLLNALARQGHQVIDLEHLAQHRGSVLGSLPGQTQPSQKWFDSLLLQVMRQLEPTRPVYIEAESNKIGSITLPEALCEAMHRAPCLQVEVPLAERVRFLLEDYAFYQQQPELLVEQLSILTPRYGRKQMASWVAMARRGEFSQLAEILLTRHYDPAYFRSTGSHYRELPNATRLTIPCLTEACLNQACASL